ncbi:acetylesterase [Verrucomicrobiaceae bacterium N1E253]|uniref:Acetylesterase n=1 Tax=Oceaniferula marina TaxID=2748318 RepID=A0A851GB78_9BACT|nr:DUF6288 domain-containing protein [Oceaniferula marina]NWK55008.1 acetylesterase [Oceaniferula marina]
MIKTITSQWFVILITGVSCWLELAASLQAAGNPSIAINPDFTKGASIPAGASHDWNLGPTGIRGWMYSHKMETSEARQIAVTQVAKGSPADPTFQLGDVILGLVGKPFNHDPRTEFGKAISAAEATNGELQLIRWRQGKTSNVTVKLPILGAYSATAPFDCAKSKRIFEQGCKALAIKMKAKPEAGNGITRSLNALALLASGNPEYLPIIREQVKWAANYRDPESRSLHSWFYGPVNILLAEYTIATGDQRFMPDLKRITMEIVHGQSQVGSWGHRFIREDGRLGGYGMMNAPGLPLTVSLILARKAGVKDPALDRAIEKSARLIRFYVGKGSVPYGDHHPWIQTHDDNGKNGIAAVMFNLLDDAEAAGYFSSMSIASYGGERDNGHTGNFLNMLWAMPGVAISGPHASGAWMKEFGWYYDLARCSDGSYRHQGPPATKPDSYRNWDCTGAYLLAYAQPLRKIFLTGKKQGVATQISKQSAAQFIEDGKGWSSKNKNSLYADLTDEELYEKLKSWSPVVRERAALALAKRDTTSVDRFIPLLKVSDLPTQLGACQALAKLKAQSAPAVPALINTLKSRDLWLRVKAAEALAAIGPAAKPALPELLTILANNDLQNDPRAMEQRYLCFALFAQRDGLLRGSLDGVNREALYAAVRNGLKNEDGRARSSLASVFKKLTFEEIEPLLPAIHAAVVEPAPSGIMFASGILLSGLEILAKYHIREGLPLCFEVMEIEKWGKKNRITGCLKALQLYEGSAKPMLPRLKQLERQLRNHREAKSLESTIELIQTTTKLIESSSRTPTLRSIGH